MWGSRRRRKAQRDPDRSDAILARLDAQEPEVSERLDRLNKRLIENHLAEAFLATLVKSPEGQR